MAELRMLLVVVGVVLLGALRATAKDEAGPPVQPQPVLVAPMGHTQMVLSVAISRDGRYVLTGSDDTTAKLWETATGRELRRFAGQAKGVHSVGFSPDGTEVITASFDGTVRLLETATGHEIRRFEGHTGPVRSAALSPDGRLLITTSDDTTARLWETATGRELRRLSGHTKSVLAAAFSPGGRQVLTGSADRSMRLWETETGKEIRQYEGLSNAVRSLAFSPDGTLFLTGYWNLKARLWNTATGDEVRPLVGDTMGSLSVAFSPDGTHILTSSRDGSARLWDTATGAQVRRFAGHDGEVYASVFSPDGTRVLTGAYDRTARLRETATGKEVRRFEGHARSVLSVRFSPDGASIVRGSRDGSAGLWDTDNGWEVRRFLGHTRGVTAASTSADGRTVLTGSFDRTARLWEADTGREVRRLAGHEAAVNAAVFSSAGTHVLTGSDDKTARVWEVATGDTIRRFVGHTASVKAAVFSTDDQYVLTGSDDKTARLWATATGRVVRPVQGHSLGVTSVAFSPDGTRFLTGSWDRTARLWETATGRELRRFEGHAKGVVSVAFSPDGTQVLTGSWDKTAWLWDAATGRVLQRFEGHTGEVMSVAIAPDGGRVVTSSADATIGVWDPATGREFCSLRSFTDGRWAVVDAGGRFDSCNGGDVQGLYWVVGMEVIALEQLKDRYLEPRLLAKHLGRNPEPLRDVVPFTQPRLYPGVRVENKGGVLQVHVEDQGGGIGRVVIMVNGKELTADARDADSDATAGTLTLVSDVSKDPRLLPGEENHIEVFAYNAEGYLRSRGVTVAYESEGEKQDTSLWAVVAGVSDYAGDTVDLDLRFAAKDAENFASVVTMASGVLFGESNTHVSLLTDASVTREGLKAAFAGLRQAKAGDILVVYLAGHGVTEGDGFYYLTADAATADLSDPGLRATTALSSSEMIEAIKQIPALKQVLILDTCSSGSFIDVLTSKRGASSSHLRALERVKDRTGMFVLAGCASDKGSYEAAQYGQGLLTYSLLLGMKGGRLHQNDLVDVSTLFHFAADKVPEFARMLGRVQRPVVASPKGGNSFYIGKLTEKELAAIPLQEARPLFVRSSLQDDEEAADVLELGQGVDEALGEEAARDHAASLVFVDAGLFPGAYQIAGTYTTKDGTTAVRFKLRRDKKAVTEWIEVAGPVQGLPDRIVAEVKRKLAAEAR